MSTSEKKKLKIVTLGHCSHGKTSLTLQLMGYSMMKYGPKSVDLGCDPCMTKEGRLLKQLYNDLSGIAWNCICDEKEEKEYMEFVRCLKSE